MLSDVQLNYALLDLSHCTYMQRSIWYPSYHFEPEVVWC